MRINALAILGVMVNLGSNGMINGNYKIISCRYYAVNLPLK